jgi:hypothetical protein
MRTYEKDTEIKIPSWYLKLPQKTINRISDIGLAINHLLPQPRKKRIKKTTSKRNVTFYL